MDLKAEARRLVEEAIANCNGDPNLTWYSALESALLAFGRLVREEDAKAAVSICEYGVKWPQATKEEQQISAHTSFILGENIRLMAAEGLKSLE